MTKVVNTHITTHARVRKNNDKNLDKAVSVTQKEDRGQLTALSAGNDYWRKCYCWIYQCSGYGSKKFFFFICGVKYQKKTFQSTNEDTFKKICQPLVDDVLGGDNACLIGIS